MEKKETWVLQIDRVLYQIDYMVDSVSKVKKIVINKNGIVQELVIEDWETHTYKFDLAGVDCRLEHNEDEFSGDEIIKLIVAGYDSATLRKEDHSKFIKSTAYLIFAASIIWFLIPFIAKWNGLDFRKYDTTIYNTIYNIMIVIGGVGAIILGFANRKRSWIKTKEGKTIDFIESTKKLMTFDKVLKAKKNKKENENKKIYKESLTETTETKTIEHYRKEVYVKKSQDFVLQAIFAVIICTIVTFVFMWEDKYPELVGNVGNQICTYIDEPIKEIYDIEYYGSTTISITHTKETTLEELNTTEQYYRKILDKKADKRNITGVTYSYEIDEEGNVKEVTVYDFSKVRIRELRRIGIDFPMQDDGVNVARGSFRDELTRSGYTCGGSQKFDMDRV